MTLRFLDFLNKKGFDYKIARPYELDDPNFKKSISRRPMPIELINQVAVSGDKKSGKTDLASYSRGNLELVDSLGGNSILLKRRNNKNLFIFYPFPYRDI